MAQPQTDGMMRMLDPFGIWKTYRDTTLEGWSKIMIDMVNSEEYARSTGTMLDQYLSMSQPVQDAVQKNMTMALAYLNMPTRDEVLSVAERLVNIETRLDDLDAETSYMRDDYREEFRNVDRSLDKVLNTLITRLDKLEAAISTPRESAGAKPEPK